MDVSFDGCDVYEVGDLYEFSNKFSERWTNTLPKFIPDSKAFEKKYGKGWGLSFCFRANGRTRRKVNLLGPFKERYLRCKQVGWAIELPSFRYKSPDPKAYVPLLRQVLQQMVIALTREQIDASKLQKNSESLLKDFASRPDMLEPGVILFMEEEKKAERERAMDSGALLKADKVISGHLKRLRRKYKLKFGIAFDASGTERHVKGWQADYVVVDLTVASPSEKRGIPDDLYDGAIEIFRQAENILKRSRTFFCFRIVPGLNKMKWSVALLLNNRDLAGTHSLVGKIAGEFLSLMAGNAEFRADYAAVAHLLCAYSQRDERLYVSAWEAPVAFNEHCRDAEDDERCLLSDKCGTDIVCMTGVHLGNLNYSCRRYRDAIPHWQEAADNGQPEALMCIGGAYASLGDMKKAFQFCKQAIRRRVPRKLLDDGPDFAEFRRHPLYAKIRGTRAAKPARPAKPLSPRWSMPKNLKKLVEENDGAWDDERWNPILLTAISGKSLGGRSPPLIWQLQFDPYHRRFTAGRKKLEARGIEPNGDAWTDIVETEFVSRYPRLAREFDSDSESSTCVVSVHSGNACKKLLEVIWSLVYPK